MQIVAITHFDSEQISFQWFSNQGKEKHTASYQWSEIVKAEVFKRDMVIYDLICLQFYIEENEGIEIDEDDLFWNELVLELPKHLSGFKKWSEWFQDVAFPAFKSNLINVYTAK